MSKFSFAKAEKKPLTHAQQTVKTVLNWVVNILCVVIILIALIISILTITRTVEGGKGVANIFGYAFMPVQSDSMSGTFEKDDMIITKIYKGDGSDIKVGQVITFSKSVNQGGTWITIYNTHRVVEVNYTASSGYRYATQGDHEASRDTAPVPLDRVVATWGTPGSQGNEDSYGGNWGQIGKVINTLQNDRTIYFCCIVLPLILLFVLYAFFLIRSLVINKIAATKAEAAAAIATGGVASLTEEDKRRLAEEYLASLAAQQSGESAPTDADAPASDDADANAEETVEAVSAEEKSDEISAEAVESESDVEAAPSEEIAAVSSDEQTVTEVPVEETVSVDDAPAEVASEEPKEKKAPAKKTAAKKSADAVTKKNASKKSEKEGE